MIWKLTITRMVQVKLHNKTWQKNLETAQVPFEVQQHNQELLVDEHIDDDVNCSTKLEQQNQPDTVNLICKPNHVSLTMVYKKSKRLKFITV